MNPASHMHALWPAGVLSASMHLGADALVYYLRAQLTINRALPCADPSAQPAVPCALQVTALEVSLVDHVPEELLAATLLGLRLEYAAGIGPERDFVSARLSLDSAQLDDEQAATRWGIDG